MRKRKLTALALSLLSVMTVSACSTPPESESLKMSGTYFDTIVQVEAWGADQETMDQCKEICSRYEQLFSTTIDTSEISQINHAHGQTVTVSDDTAELIRKGIEYGDLSGGMFDITIASADSLWNFTDNKDKTIPDEKQLQEAVEHINYKNIKIDGNDVTLTDPDAMIDLGGIAKGYIADRLKDYLKSKGVRHALINLGGNMLALGDRYDGSSFRIGLQKPFSDTGEVLGVLPVKDQSVVTSGDYERYFEKDGVIYHHILDPHTGYPIQNDLDQVTIISDESVDGDALSTVCYTLGLEKGMELIHSLDNIEAVFVTKDGEIHASSDSLNLQKSDT